MATTASDQQAAADEAGVASPTAPTVSAPDPGRARGSWGEYAGGAVATLAIAGLSIWVMAAWSAGASGDVLLGVAAVGLLLCLPHTIAAWTGLTLLVATAAALLAGAQGLAESFADLAYYGLAVACAWGIWNDVARRFSWRMPARMLADRIVGGAPGRTPRQPVPSDAGRERDAAASGA